MSFSNRRRSLSTSILAAALARMAPSGALGALLAASGSVAHAATDKGAGRQAPQLSAMPSLANAFTLDYDVYYGSASSRGVRVAHATYRFSRRGERYRLNTEARATGVLSVFYSGTLLQSSTGTISDQGFVPQRYSEKRGKRAEKVFEFDASKKRIKLQGEAGAGYAYPDGIQDRLSIFFQLGLLARNGTPELKKGQRFVLPLAGSHRVDEPFLEVIGPERLRTNAGTLDTLRFAASKPGDADAPRFDLWLAPELKMLPVRIRVYEKSNSDTVVDQVLNTMPTNL